jgi:hypothetical protein
MRVTANAAQNKHRHTGFIFRLRATPALSPTVRKAAGRRCGRSIKRFATRELRNQPVGMDPQPANTSYNPHLSCNKSCISNQVIVRPPRRRAPHLVASRATIPSPRPPSASSPGGLSSASPGPLRSVTSTRTVPAQAVTVTVTVSPGRPELLCRTLLPKSSLASRTASSPQGCPGPSTAPTNARTTRARSPRPATFTLSRTIVPAISAPAFPSARKHRKSERTHGNARSPQPPTSSRICVPGADRSESIRRDPSHFAYCRLAPRPAKPRSIISSQEARRTTINSISRRNI